MCVMSDQRDAHELPDEDFRCTACDLATARNMWMRCCWVHCSVEIHPHSLQQIDIAGLAQVPAPF